MEPIYRASRNHLMRSSWRTSATLTLWDKSQSLSFVKSFRLLLIPTCRIVVNFPKMQKHELEKFYYQAGEVPVCCIITQCHRTIVALPNILFVSVPASPLCCITIETRCSNYMVLFYRPHNEIFYANSSSLDYPRKL